jgi:hypothetical protein
MKEIEMTSEHKRRMIFDVTEMLVKWFQKVPPSSREGEGDWREELILPVAIS